ncbi:MAG: MlaA family lipoprotein [Cyanobacteria bacterium RUI128]|nr:MlaA family lipoprotein [Cyanobacteria bacterium RUI128]
MKRRIIALIFLICFVCYNAWVCVQAFEYPDYAYEFLGPDKHEKYNRKMFNFDRGLNKYVIKPIHILWASILPQYMMGRLYGISYNIEYPIRLVSSLVQKDFHNAGNETKRFFVNTTIGLAGMFDPAKRYMKIEKSYDNMDKAFARRNIKPGPYFVAPVIVFTSVRDIFGRIFDIALNPSTYVGTPLIAAIKAGMMINKTSYWQSIICLVETSFADPYEITKKAFAIDRYIKKQNYDRVEVMSKLRATEEEKNVVPAVNNKEPQAQLAVSAKIVKGKKPQKVLSEGEIIEAKLGLTKVSIEPDLHLEDYAPQSPMVDSMRTTLFAVPGVNKSIWNEMSLWNRSFANRIKSDSINITEGRDNYTFRYILQKDKNAPLAIIYPSTGDGVKASHPIMFAKLFYDAGYSVLIHGNPFQWEFVKSMPEDYRPGLPSRDAYMMRVSTTKIIEKLQKKYNCQFGDKVCLGTSLAALDLLFMAEQESKDNTMGQAQFIAICPPIDLVYSVKQVDAFSQEWTNFGDDLKPKVAMAASKAVKMYHAKKDIDFLVNHLPFDEDEAKLFTSFVMHQRLSDVVFVIEKVPTNKKSDFYPMIYKMGFEDYMQKYVMVDEEAIQNELDRGFGLVAISDFLEKANNYKIYHTKNDYLVNRIQLKQLKRMAGKKMTIIDNGSHLGFLYRPEFQDDLRKTVTNMKNAL